MNHWKWLSSPSLGLQLLQIHGIRRTCLWVCKPRHRPLCTSTAYAVAAELRQCWRCAMEWCSAEATEGCGVRSGRGLNAALPPRVVANMVYTMEALSKGLCGSTCDDCACARAGAYGRSPSARWPCWMYVHADPLNSTSCDMHAQILSFEDVSQAAGT